MRELELGPGGIDEVHWELTNHCNLACVHCYLAPDERPELSTEKCLSLIEEMSDAGVLGLTLSGGEPLLRRDFAVIYRRAHELGFLLNVFTNGTRITDEIIELFLELPPQKVEITLNGITKETFEKVTARAGSFEKCMDGIRRLESAGIFLGLKTNGMTLNAHEVGEIKKFAEGLRNTFFKFDTAIMPRRDHDMAPTALRLKPREIFAIYGSHPEMKAQITEECGKQVGNSPPSRAAFQCEAGRSRFHISAWGDLHPCHTVRPIRESLLKMSFKDAVQAVEARVRSVHYPESSKCGSCGNFAVCNSCPGLAHLEKRSQLFPTEYHCEVAHETAREYGPGVLA